MSCSGLGAKLGTLSAQIELKEVSSGGGPRGIEDFWLAFVCGPWGREGETEENGAGLQSQCCD